MVGRHPARQPRHVRVNLRHLRRVAEVEHRGALLAVAGLVVEGAEQLVPEDRSGAASAGRRLGLRCEVALS
jgi:hypothetical protein